MPDDSRKTKAQLLDEVQELRERVGILENKAAEGKQTEEALLESQALYHELVEETDDLKERLTDVTDRKRAEKALRESEERFRTIYENAPVLIDAFDENGRCVLWNEQCRETFGWTIDEINAHDDALALFYPDPEVRDEVMRTVTTDPDGRFREWHPITKDGRVLSTMWANFRLSSPRSSAPPSPPSSASMGADFSDLQTYLGHCPSSVLAGHYDVASEERLARIAGLAQGIL